MFCIWRHGATNVYEIRQRLEGLLDKVPAVATLHTYLARLIAKGLLASQRLDPSSTLLTYTPLISYEDALRREFLRFCEDYLIRDPESLEVVESTFHHLPVLARLP